MTEPMMMNAEQLYNRAIAQQCKNRSSVEFLFNHSRVISEIFGIPLKEVENDLLELWGKTHQN